MVLIISLVGFATVTVILLIKTKLKVQTRAMTVTLEKIPSRKPATIENKSDITTNENIAYVVHSPKTVTTEH